MIQDHQIPVVIEFSSGSRFSAAPENLPENGSETYIEFDDDQSIALPKDQLMLAEVKSGRARIGIGGMSFEGLHKGEFVFYRVKDLNPDAPLPECGIRLTLPSQKVKSIRLEGRTVWNA